MYFNVNLKLLTKLIKKVHYLVNELHKSSLSLKQNRIIGPILNQISQNVPYTILFKAVGFSVAVVLNKPSSCETLSEFHSTPLLS